MPSRNVAVRKDVYEALDRERRPGESFSRLFLRFLHEKGPLEEILGAWGKAEPGRETRLLQRLRGPGTGGRGG